MKKTKDSPMCYGDITCTFIWKKVLPLWVTKGPGLRQRCCQLYFSNLLVDYVVVTLMPESIVAQTVNLYNSIYEVTLCKI